MKNHSTIGRMEYDHCNGDHQYNPDHYLELLTRRIRCCLLDETYG